ncbi:hypothetical protein KFK09_013454 [Dendrobium nobile]|uniref:Uncharacterized protein n=1 Tax=Dendrobium nobile TaxID=94219 RepID=A0A8T3B9N7_DENNO|nr:hypothetical protein KFK09_013454 [Dendrobium nobile]
MLGLDSTARRNDEGTKEWRRRARLGLGWCGMMKERVDEDSVLRLASAASSHDRALEDFRVLEDFRENNEAGRWYAFKYKGYRKFI